MSNLKIARPSDRRTKNAGRCTRARACSTLLGNTLVPTHSDTVIICSAFEILDPYDRRVVIRSARLLNYSNASASAPLVHASPARPPISSWVPRPICRALTISLAGDSSDPNTAVPNHKLCSVIDPPLPIQLHPLCIYFLRPKDKNRRKYRSENSKCLPKSHSFSSRLF